MQQGGSQYGMTTPPPAPAPPAPSPPQPEMTPPFTSTTTNTTTHMLGLSSTSPDQLQHKKSGDASGEGAATSAIPMVIAEAASPISSRPPLPPRNFEEFAMPSGGGGFPDEEGLGVEEGERGFSGGNRWPRQETIALLKIRSEMDAAFRDATLKGPLWEDVSRKLAEQGYHRSGKKCKEKFENVHKYYKRTKEGRAGRQDGKSYRFFSELEALHTTTTTTTVSTIQHPSPVPVSIGIGMVTSPVPVSAAAPVVTTNTRINTQDLSGGVQILSAAAAATSTPAGGISFSTNTSSSNSESDQDDDMEEEEEGGGGPSNTRSRKRKRGGSGRGERSSNRKMMNFFEGLMKQVMEKQEAMQQRFLETIEKREQDRMIREEAWKRQEMARLNREHEIIAQERAISASRDAAIITFLQKMTGQPIQMPSTVVIPATPPPVPVTVSQPQPQSTPPPPAPVQVKISTPPPAPAPAPQQQRHVHHQHHRQEQQLSHSTEIVKHQPVSTEMVVAAIPEQQHPPAQEMVVIGGSGGGSGFDSTTSRWPKTEVLALIKLRSGLESRYQEAGPKGPLWEEISAGMQRMGYNRSSKRCKEKWENINKYFKKVKESNKKRPEDAKTCPYFHQLDALYRKKMLGGSSSSSSFGNQNKQEQQRESNTTTTTTTSFQAIMAPPPQPPQAPASTTTMTPTSTSQAMESENKNKNNTNSGSNTERFSEEGTSGNVGGAAVVKKPENIMKELNDQHQQQSVMEDYDKLEEPDSDNLDQEEEDDEEEEEEDEEQSKLAYKIQFQRQNANAGSSNGGGNAPNSFLAMVQ